MKKIQMLEEKSSQKPDAEQALLQRISELESKLKESKESEGKGNGSHAAAKPNPPDRESKPAPRESATADTEDPSGETSGDDEDDDPEGITTPDGVRASLLHIQVYSIMYTYIIWIYFWLTDISNSFTDDI